MSCFLCRGQKLTLFLSAGLKLLVFGASMEIGLVLVMEVKFDLISVGGIERGRISVRDEIYLVS